MGVTLSGVLTVAGAAVLLILGMACSALAACGGCEAWDGVRTRSRGSLLAGLACAAVGFALSLACMHGVATLLVDGGLR